MTEDEQIERVFGRLPCRDDRDLRFLMSREPVGLLYAEDYRKPFRYYNLGPVLDQKDTPMCVGYAWRQWLSSSLIMTRGGPAAEQIYHEAQKVDEWPGENYAGTSVRAGAKVLQALGHILEYRWAWDANTVADWILSDRGTVVVGTNWYLGMNEPDEEGRVWLSGRVLGGHAYLVTGYNLNKDLFRCANSWGRGWGRNGSFYLVGEDMDRLLHESGEACAAVEAKVPA